MGPSATRLELRVDDAALVFRHHRRRASRVWANHQRRACRVEKGQRTVGGRHVRLQPVCMHSQKKVMRWSVVADLQAARRWSRLALGSSRQRSCSGVRSIERRMADRARCTTFSGSMSASLRTNLAISTKVCMSTWTSDKAHGRLGTARTVLLREVTRVEGGVVRRLVARAVLRHAQHSRGRGRTNARWCHARRCGSSQTAS
jgi:hypothetical protein